jgi:hypothetical protein
MDPTAIFLTLLGLIGPVLGITGGAALVVLSIFLHLLKLVINSLTDNLVSGCLLIETEVVLLIIAETSSCLDPHAHEALLRFKHDVSN